jgi:hypothetical protein
MFDIPMDFQFPLCAERFPADITSMLRMHLALMSLQLGLTAECGATNLTLVLSLSHRSFPFYQLPSGTLGPYTKYGPRWMAWHCS